MRLAQSLMNRHSSPSCFCPFPNGQPRVVAAMSQASAAHTGRAMVFMARRCHPIPRRTATNSSRERPSAATQRCRAHRGGMTERSATGFVRTLLKFRELRMTGVLTVAAEGVTTVFYLGGGRVMFAEGGTLRESLGRILVECGT